MTGLHRLTVHVLVEDPRVLAAMPRDQRPLDADLAVPAEIAVTAIHAEALSALTVGEGSAWIVDHLTDEALCVISEGDGDYLAFRSPRETVIRRMLLRADGTCTTCPT